MARKAFVSSDMAHDEKLYDLAEEYPDAVLMWPWIVTWFDDWGRALASPKRIKSQLFPNLPHISVDTVEAAIRAYSNVGLIEVYEDEKHRYMAIPMDKWYSWQTHIRGEKRDKDNSKYPPCPTDSAQVRAGDSEVRADARNLAQLTEKRTPSLSLTLSSTEREKARACKGEGNDREEEIDESLMTDVEVAVSRLTRFHLEQNLKPPMTDLVKDRIVAMCTEYQPPWILEAIEEAKLRGAKSLGYLDTVLIGWSKDGKSSKERREEERANGQRQRDHTTPTRTNPEPKGEFAGLRNGTWTPPADTG